ncbi:MAG: BON domain-containing protein [Candidatus Omnitrophica bacterium]|nr:BON domain-containing protein [Candidatus Omnitrophota bacterium]
MKREPGNENIEGLDLKARVVKALGDVGIDASMVSVDIVKGEFVRVRGEVPSEHMRESLRDIVEEIAGEGHIIDEVIVLRGLDEASGDDYLYDDGALYGEHDEYIGTEDAYRSLEDGIPYIPPTESSYREYEDRKGRRGRRRPR